MIGDLPGEIHVDTIGNFAGTVGLIGLVGAALLRARLALRLRQALEVVFAVPRGEQPNFLIGKARDLLHAGR